MKRRDQVLQAVRTAFAASIPCKPRGEQEPKSAIYSVRRDAARLRAELAAHELAHCKDDGAARCASAFRRLARQEGEENEAHGLNDNRPLQALQRRAERLEARRERLIHNILSQPENPGQVRRLIMLGDVRRARKVLSRLEVPPEKTAALAVDILIEEGRIRDAERLAARLVHLCPDDRRLHQLQVSAGFRELVVPIEAAPGSPQTAPQAAAHISRLIAMDDFDRAGKFAEEITPIVSSSPELALMVLEVLYQRARADNTSLDFSTLDINRLPMPLRLREPIAPVHHRILPYIAELAETCADADAAWPAWYPLIERLYSEIPPWVPDTPNDRKALQLILATDPHGNMRRRLALVRAAQQAGWSCRESRADPEVRAVRARFKKIGEIPAKAVRAARTPAAQMFLDRVRRERLPLVVFSLHGIDLGPGRSLVDAALAGAGLDVLGVTQGRLSTMSVDPASDQQNGSFASSRLRYLSRKFWQPAQITHRLLAQLDTGGTVIITNDNMRSSGRRVLVPWFLQSHVLTTMPALLAVERGAEVAIGTLRLEGRAPRVDFKTVEVPEGGDGRTRAIWLTQRIARRVRSHYANATVDVTPTTLSSYGGVPLEAEVVPLTEWGAARHTRRSLVGWLAQPVANPNATALSMPTEEIGAEDLRNLALRAAAMFLHFQPDAPDHRKDPEAEPTARQFLDQHRVMAILPKGCALVALTLGSWAAGSLMCVVETDVAPEQIAERIKDFEPHLIVSTASLWTELARVDPEWERHPVLIIGDDAGQSAAKDLLESFEPAKALPPFDPNLPALAIFTSGSSGRPKAAVLPTRLLSGGTGVDQLAQLNHDDRVCQLARWDGVSLSDVLAVLRCGATICVPGEELVRVPGRLAEWIQRTSITVFSTPPTILKLLLSRQTDEIRSWSKLRFVFVWGERTDRQLIRAIGRDLPDAEILSAYGTSEVFYVTWGRIDPDDLDPDQSSYAGAVLPSVSITLSDAETGQKTTGTGIPTVTSEDAMLGYLHDLKKRNPPRAADQRGSVTLTDLVRITERGKLDILGRVDGNVKIAGRMVAPAECERAALSVEGIDDAIAFVIEDDVRTAVAMAVVANGAEDTGLADTVADRIADRVFAAARPIRTTVFAAFPQLSSGKVDRVAVRAAVMGEESDETARPATPDGPEAPVVPLSPMLHALHTWAEKRGHGRRIADFASAQVPSFSSLDLIEISLLAEEINGTAVSEMFADELQSRSWRDLAERLGTWRNCR